MYKFWENAGWTCGVETNAIGGEVVWFGKGVGGGDGHGGIFLRDQVNQEWHA